MSTEALARCPGQYPPTSTGAKPKSVLWNGMVAPLIQVAIRGAYWYQGEANAESNTSTAQYACLINSLIRDWRERQGLGDFAFVVMQLPPSVTASTDPTVRQRRRHSYGACCLLTGLLSCRRTLVDLRSERARPVSSLVHEVLLTPVGWQLALTWEASQVRSRLWCCGG